ncbi:MAG: FAD-dependent oxidoreductase [Bacillota bacterium]|nr:FAD-dependent oxidoreductase [Bacillota bacterium]
MGKKVCIVGGVAGGASCATRLRRLDEEAEIILFERGPYISFANCGLPYHVSRAIPKRESLLVATPKLLQERFRCDVRTENEVTAIDRARQEVEVRDLRTGKTYRERYDFLVLSPGAAPLKPSLPGIDLPGVFTLRTIPDMDGILRWLSGKQAREAVVLGGGFIGLEMAENFRERGLDVSIMEMMDQVMAPLDYEMAALVQAHLREKGVRLYLGEQVQEIKERAGKLVVRTGSREVPADLVLVAVGLRPETKLAAGAGLELGPTGGVRVDAYLRTSDPKIYAVGDAIEVRHFVSGTPVIVPLAGPANRQGRLAADNICGREIPYRGTQGTSICKVFELTVAATGLNARVLARHQIPFQSVIVHPLSHAGYYPGGKQLSLKLLFGPDDGRILGVQAVGEEGADKRIDALATALRAGMTVFDLEHLELAYAPPYSSAKDPVNIAGFAAANVLRGDVAVTTWDRVPVHRQEGAFFLDVRTPKEFAGGALPGAVNISVDELRERLKELPRDRRIVVNCAVGLRSYIACRILKAAGFHDVLNLSGGYRTYQAAAAPAGAPVPETPEVRVPGAGNIRLDAGEIPPAPGSGSSQVIS